VNGNWIADGSWKPQTSFFDQKLAQQAKAAKMKVKPAVMDDDPGRPVLKRAPSSGSDDTVAQAGTSSPASTAPQKPDANAPPPSDNDDADRPTLKKPAESADTSARPTLSDKTAAPAAASAPGSVSDENDPDRPVLTRGAQPKQKNVQPAKSNAVAQNPAAAKTAPVAGTKSAGALRAYPAISDNSDYEMRPLLFAMSASEREDRSRQMLAIAMDELRKFAATRKAPPLPKTAAITDYDLRAFDLDFSNSPTMVLTGKLPVAAPKTAHTGEFDYFVTVVARVDIQGTPQKIFSSVTDSNYLDAFPRLQLIDAIDADANGRGDLLFRQYSDGGVSYGLYRVYPYSLRKVFEGGAGM